MNTKGLPAKLNVIFLNLAGKIYTEIIQFASATAAMNKLLLSIKKFCSAKWIINLHVMQHVLPVSATFCRAKRYFV